MPAPRARALLSAGLVAAIAAGQAHAGPWLAPHPGGLGFFGPTDPEATAIWFNAAALGELPGSHIHLSGSPVVLSEDLDRAGMPAVRNQDLQPDLFAAATTDFTIPYVRFGLAYHVPFRDQGSIGHDADVLDPALHVSPLRYQRLHTTLRNDYLSPAAAFRVNSSVSFGIGMNIVRSEAHLSFDRDRPLDFGQPGTEQPAQAERLDVNGTATSVGFQIGFLWRILGRVTIGGAYISRAIGLSRSSVPASDYDNDTNTPNLHITSAGGNAVHGYGQIAYFLPDVVHFGARWLVTDRLEAAAQLRYVDWGQRSNAIRIRMTSQALRAAGEPDEIVLYRGFRDTYQAIGRGAYCARPPERVGERCRLRLGLSAGFDTGQYDPESVGADALDGPTLELGLLFDWRVSKHVRLVGGGSYAAMLSRHVTDSVYRPDAAVQCAAAGRAFSACMAVDAGQAAPTQNGSYGLQSYTGSLGVVFDWWSRY
jgi:long-subunit fatty acid transport protein